jgi:HEAT repeat protein
MNQQDPNPSIDARLIDLASDHPGSYESAGAWFLRQGPPIAPALAAALDNPDLGAIAHWRILLLLRQFADPGTLPAILRVLRSAAARRDPIVLPGAMEAAAAFRDPEAAQALIELLQHPDPDTVKHAAVLAGGTGDARAFEPLLRLLANPSPLIRYSAAKGLIALGGPAVQDSLRRHLESETDPEVRALILSAGGGAGR